MLATTIVRHNVNEPTYYRIDDRQNRHDGPHRQPYLAAAGYVVAVATEYPIGKGAAFSEHYFAGNIGGKLHNESDPKRPDIFDDWQHQ